MHTRSSHTPTQQQGACMHGSVSQRAAEQTGWFLCAGLFEWSMKYQDGTREGGAPQPLDPEKKAW